MNALLADGRLETILPDEAPTPALINVGIVPERASIARVRLLVEFLTEQIPRIPDMERASSRR